jgi:hypothetical protein
MAETVELKGNPSPQTGAAAAVSRFKNAQHRDHLEFFRGFSTAC